MFVPLFVLAALQIPDKIQTWLLYHNALSEGVLIDTILKQARRTQKSELDMHASMTMESNAESIVELKRKLDEQQQVISRLLKNNNASSHIQDVFSSGLPAAELTTTSGKTQKPKKPTENGAPIDGQAFLGRGPIG